MKDWEGGFREDLGLADLASNHIAANRSSEKSVICPRVRDGVFNWALLPM